MKKILILSRADIVGAGSVAKDLRNFLLSEDEYEIKIYTRYSRLECDYVISYDSKSLGKLYELIRAFKFKFNQIFNKLIDFDYAPLSLNERVGWYKSENLLRKLNGFTPDILIVLFMDGFVNFRNIYDFYRSFGCSVYLYPMDMAMMTGGCHYSNGCTGFLSDCDNCPIFLIKGSIARNNILFKDEYLKKIPFKVLSGSKELLDQLKMSYLFKNANIFNYIVPINAEIFHPKPKANFTNFTAESKKILLGSQTLGLKRKGGDLVIEILNCLYARLESSPSHLNVEVIIVGKVTGTFLNLIKFTKKSLGRVTLNELVDIYNISDIFISSSREDSGPMMINQSLMCGTPVISFDVGVAKDLVKNNETGFLIEKFDIQNYVSKLEYILRLSEKDKETMKMNCRNTMVNIERVPIN